MQPVDFDAPETFPRTLGTWDDEFEKMVRKAVCSDKSEWSSQSLSLLRDLRIYDMPIVKGFVNSHADMEFVFNHVTRILNKDSFLREGLVTGGGGGGVGELRLKGLLKHIGADANEADQVLANARLYWDRDKDSRTEAVHFSFDKSWIYQDYPSMAFAKNLGGEIMRWSLSGIDEELYRREPYKRLWIEGVPSIVRFKCRLSDVHPDYRNELVAEIVQYFIVARMFGEVYRFRFAGRTSGPVPPDNIVGIEEIEDFVAIQEQFDEFKDFYDEPR